MCRRPWMNRKRFRIANAAADISFSEPSNTLHALGQVRDQLEVVDDLTARFGASLDAE